MGPDLNSEKRNLLLGVRGTVRYHCRRRMFFDSLYKWSQALALISGSATVVIVISKYADGTLTIWFAAAVAISSALNPVFGFVHSSRVHSDLAKMFIDLEKQIVLDVNPTVESMKAFTTQKLMIEAKRPLTLKNLMNEENKRLVGFSNRPESGRDMTPTTGASAASAFTSHP
jgi:hypothetical protein